MPKKIVSFTLSEKSIEQIGRASKALGMSRSELIDFLAREGFHFSKEVKAALDEIAELQEETQEKIKDRRINDAK